MEGQNLTTGYKIASARKTNNLTQEQLAELLDVTRQSVSRWEQDLAYPETDKLIKLAKILNLDINYLLGIVTDTANVNQKSTDTSSNTTFSKWHYEYKSKCHIGKIPLVHINLGFGNYKAKGVFAIGNISIGIISIGLVSLGLISIGLLSIGLLLALGCFGIGFMAMGAISIGILSLGAIAIGVLSIGALSVGTFSIGALSVGNYFAIGDVAYGNIAIGSTRAIGSIYESCSGINNSFIYDSVQIKELLSSSIPAFLNWIANIIKVFL